MNINKIIGWVTFGIGIFVILFTLYSTYQIFTGEKPAPQFFQINLPEETAPEEMPEEMPSSQEGMMQMMSQKIESQLQEMIPASTLPKLLNLVIWTMGAGILIFGGSQIAQLGIRLVKD